MVLQSITTFKTDSHGFPNDLLFFTIATRRVSILVNLFSFIFFEESTDRGDTPDP